MMLAMDLEGGRKPKGVLHRSWAGLLLNGSQFCTLPVVTPSGSL